VTVGGFIVLPDGRAYAAASWATDATVRAIARSITDDPLRTWLLAQQSEHVGVGMTRVDLREIAPQLRPVMASAIRDAFRQVQAGEGFEQPTVADRYWDGWIQRFADLVEMLDRSEVGGQPAEFNPHMRALLPSRNGRVGPGWGTDERG
jgi:hypothetical protein